MGYTHYMRTDNWDRQDEMGFEKGAKIVRKILKKYDNLVQREYDEDKKPLCTKKSIQFNGIGDDGHETFVLSNAKAQTDFDFNPTFSFCKTARKPYDIVTCEVLLVMNAFCPHLAISSDGFSGYLETKEIDGEWANAVKNVKEYGIHYHIEVVEEREPYCDFMPILDKVEG
jgi:hypothetical protein